MVPAPVDRRLPMDKLVKLTDVHGKSFAVPHNGVTLTEAASAEQGNTVIHARGQAFYVNESIDDILGLLVGEKPKPKKDEKAEAKAGDYPTDDEAKANAAARKAKADADDAAAQKKHEDDAKAAAAKDKADAHKSHAKAHA